MGAPGILEGIGASFGPALRPSGDSANWRLKLGLSSAVLHSSTALESDAQAWRSKRKSRRRKLTVLVEL